MTDFAWLIEAPGPHYLGTRKVGIHEFYWTPAATSAVRFMSEAQADGVMMAVRTLNPVLFGFGSTLRDARPVEHGWITTVEPTPPPSKRPLLMTPPNPGSDEALDHGCTCPVLDNGHGRGPGPFWINGDCPLHGAPSPNPQDER